MATPLLVTGYIPQSGMYMVKEALRMKGQKLAVFKVRVGVDCSDPIYLFLPQSKKIIEMKLK